MTSDVVAPPQAGAAVGPRAPKMPWMAAYLTVRDAEESIDFYRRAFGFEMGFVMRDDAGKPQHVEMEYKGEIPIMFSPEDAPGCPSKAPVSSGTTMPLMLYFYHDDVDALFVQAKAAGAKVEMEPEDMFWGDRMASFTCPNGYRWSFGTHKGNGSLNLPESGA